MVENIASLLPYTVLVSHVAFVFLLLAITSKNSWGRDVVNWLGRNALALAFAVSLLAIAGSLFYSELMGFEPCLLCWWQRIFLFPLAVIFGLALWKKNDSSFLYAGALALIAASIAAYHSYIQLGGTSLTTCTVLGSACREVYVLAFGYITIPFMSLTIALYILLLAWANKIYKNENRNA